MKKTYKLLKYIDHDSCDIWEELELWESVFVESINDTINTSWLVKEWYLEPIETVYFHPKLLWCAKKLNIDELEALWFIIHNNMIKQIAFLLSILTWFNIGAIIAWNIHWICYYNYEKLFIIILILAFILFFMDYND